MRRGDPNAAVFEADALSVSRDGKYIVNKVTDCTLEIFSTRFNK
jgi:WD40 repeat protein